ncbi:MAG: hypothetical protein KDA41_18940, partial [Planctomycetales bacterium]|nr:hypothetical protein [Planctomycetales bacterium]
MQRFASITLRWLLGASLAIVLCWLASEAPGQKKKPDRAKAKPPQRGEADAPGYGEFGIYASSAPRPAKAAPVATKLPLELRPGDRIALVGNTLFDRMGMFGHFEAMLQQKYPQHKLTVRNLAWSADAFNLQPRPENFADVEQHLLHEKADVVFVALGFNESFAGPDGLEAFRQ